MWRQLLIVLLLSDPVLLQKGGGRGSGSGSGGSKKGGLGKGPPRGQGRPGGRYIPPGYGRKPPVGRSMPSRSGRYGAVGRQPVTFHTGSGPGSYSSANSFRNALMGGALGALGGMLAFEAGKAIIQQWSKPFNYNGQDYYWDKNPNMKSDEIPCFITLEELQRFSHPYKSNTKREANSDVTKSSAASSTSPSASPKAPNDVLENLQYPNGTRPQQITWSCRRGLEVCCGTNCCPLNEYSDNQGIQGIGWVIGIIAVLVLAACCCAGIVYELMSGAEQRQDNPTIPDHFSNIPNPNDANYGQSSPYSSEPYHINDRKSYEYQLQGYPQYPQQRYLQYPQQWYQQQYHYN